MDPAIYIPEEANKLLVTETECTTVNVTDFTQYYNLLNSSSEERNWLYFAMGCLFSEPNEIPLNYLFYLGVGYSGSWQEISEESQQHLIDRGFMTEMDLQIMPAALLDKIMQDTFDISLSEAHIPDEWDYIIKEEVYCSNHNDAYLPGPFTITSVTECSDGTAVICYSVEMFYDGLTGEFYNSPALTMILQQRKDGGWIMKSNQIS